MEVRHSLLCYVLLVSRIDQNYKFMEINFTEQSSDSLMKVIANMHRINVVVSEKLKIHEINEP